MLLVIHTQDYENYAAHQGFTGEYYWKAKGGQEYKVTNLPSEFDADEVLESVRGKIEQDNEYFQTEVVGYTIQPDDYLSWFEKSQLEYDGAIAFKEPEIDYGEHVNG
jgi:hypothetical protein